MVDGTFTPKGFYERMETLLDSNYFNPLNDAFMHDDAPLFDSDYLFETNDFPALPLLCRDTVMKREIKPKSITGTKRKQPVIKPQQRENEEPKFKAWPMEDPEQAGLYDEMKVLDDLFLFDNINSKPIVPPRRPVKKQKTSSSKPKPTKKKADQTKSKSSTTKTSPSRSPRKSSKSSGVSSGHSVAKSKSNGAKLQKKHSGLKTRKVDSRNLLSPEDMDYRKAATGSRKRQRNRMKWSKDENMKLWESISKHGNNWTEIKKELACRTYYQIKDKGRRLLSVQGWISGRNKKYSHEAMYSAKMIAMNVLAEKKQGNIVKAAA